MKGAIIVTFNPNVLRLSKLIYQLVNQVDKICIVDNGSLNAYEIEFDFDSVNVIKLDENLGIARAQNIGVKYLNEYKFKYVIFFDQDSNIDSNFVEEMQQAFENLNMKNENIGILGPSLYNDKYDIYYPVLNVSQRGVISKVNPFQSNAEFIESNIIISSGSFMLINIFDKVGLMREDFFIDSVDTEFGLRVWNFGYKSYVVKNITMNHTIGDNNIVFLGKSIGVHSPFRRYYMLRNLIFMLNLKHVPYLFVVNLIMRFLLSSLIIFLYRKNKLDYLNSFFKAVFHGLSKKGFYRQ